MTKKTLASRLSIYGAAVAMIAFASACSHEQLKDEAQVSAVEESQTADAVPTYDNPTPDVNAPPTPIPGDDGLGNAPATAPKAKRHHHAKKVAKHKKTHHRKASAAKTAKHKRRVKTMVATAGTVEAAPPAPPAPPTAPAPELTQETLNAPPPPPPAEMSTEAPADESGHAVLIAGILGALGLAGFAGLKARKSRGGRKLVFN